MCASRSQHHYFGIREEYFVLALMAPIFLSCMLTDPILVSVENFNNGQDSVQLDYVSAPANQSFDFNISRFVARGNFSNDGVIRNLTLRVCPLSGSPSNLRLYFPDGGSFLLHNGTLSACEDVAVNASDLDSYFNTTTGTNLNLLWASDMFGGSDQELNLMMLKNPRIYDLDEPVTFTMLLPGIVADEVYYRCYENDSERLASAPSLEWNGSVPIPGGLLGALPPIPLPLPLANSSYEAPMSLWDFPCPAYSVQGKYPAAISRAHVYVDNSTWIETSSYIDHFDTAQFNDSVWDIRAANGSGLAYYENNWGEGALDLHSSDNSSGIIAYYSDALPFSSGEDNSVYLRVDFNHSATPFGVLYLASEKSNPSNLAALAPELYGGLLVNGSSYSLFCNLSEGPNLTGTFASENNSLEIFFDDFEANLMMYSIDGNMVSNCSLPSEDLYFAASPDPFTDMLFGNMSLDRVELYTLSVKNVSGWRWIHPESPLYQYYMNSTGFAMRFDSEVIIRDCDDYWNCPYEFLLSSDTDGGVNLSIVNITYESLVGYDGPMPSVDMDPAASFSWMGSNSTIVDSDILYQSGIFDSRIEGSQVILSDLYCVNVTDSVVRSTVRLDGFDNSTIEGVPVGSISFEPNPCGEIVDSQIDGGVFLAGSIYDSNVAGAGGAFMDLYGVDFRNYILRDGLAVMNITKYGQELPAWLSSAGLENDSFDLEDAGASLPIGVPFPIGCYEQAEFAIDGFPQERISNLEAPFACWIRLHNTHLIFSNMSILNSSVGGPVVSLENASFTIANQSDDFNLRLRSENSYLQIWNVPSAAAITLNSSHLVVSDEVVAVDSAYYGLMDGILATVRFGNAALFQDIYYYDGFTDDPSEIIADGEVCPPERCQNITQVGNALMFNTTNFSSYAVLLAEESGDDDGSSEERLSISLGSSCGGNLVSVLGSGDPVEADVSVTNLANLDDVASGDADSEGHFEFDGCGMDVRIRASASGFLPATETFSLVSCCETGCSSDIGCPEGHICAGGECLEQEIQECSLDKDCAEGYQCEDGECTERKEKETPECSSNSQCAENQICSGGSCSDLQGGKCGRFVDHVWRDYNCCEDSDCASGTICQNHTCVDEPKEELPQPQAVEAPSVVSVEPSVSSGSEDAGLERVCCMMGICGTLFGMCWFHFLLLGLAVSLLAIALFFLRRKKRK